MSIFAKQAQMNDKPKFAPAVKANAEGSGLLRRIVAINDHRYFSPKKVAPSVVNVTGDGSSHLGGAILQMANGYEY